ncbi:MAG: hypothetical protein AAGF84_07355 [Planctomycetota bacterium]
MTTPSRAIAPYVSARVFDVRMIVAPVPDFDAPPIGLGLLYGGARNPGGGGGSSIFGDEDTDDRESVDLVGITENLAELVVQSLPSGRWDDLQDVVSVTSEAGLLTVRHTNDIHAQVEELLASYEAAFGRTVELQLWAAEVPQPLLDARLEALGVSSILAPDQAEEFAAWLSGGDASPNVRIVGASRAACLNGQRTALMAGAESVLATDLEPVPDANGSDVTLGVLASGVRAVVRPMISNDSNVVLLSVVLDVVAPREGDTLDLNAQASNGETSSQTLPLPVTGVLRQRSTVRLVTGGGLVLSGAVGEEGNAVVVLVRAGTK